jgi:DNA-binding GntR family transcriptional regulator
MPLTRAESHLTPLTAAKTPRLKEPGAMEQARQHVRLMILEGSLSPGEQIRQQEMAEL